MYGRSGLDRFRKGQSLEPFSVTVHSAPSTRPDSQSVPPESVSHSNDSNFHPHYHHQQKHHVAQKSASSSSPVQSAPASATAVTSAPQVTQVGGGQSTWQPPDWAIEPRSGVYSLDVLKDGEILDRIKLDRRRHIFGRQFHTCDFVLDHQSVSRQHAAVVPHKNGSIYVIDLGSAHGTFVANERLTKDMPVELEVGQSLRFAASTRIYILRKSCAALFLSTPPHIEVNLPPPPDPSDADAVVAYNTILNRYGLTKPVLSSSSEAVGSSGKKKDMLLLQRPVKKIKKNRVVFKDQLGGELVEVVGTSDGADVDTEPGPLGVKEGSLVGKYESLVQITVIPKGKELSSGREDNGSRMGVTDKLREVLNKVKIPPKSGTGIYDDLYGDSFSVKVGSSWASSSAASATGVSSPSKTVENTTASSGTKPCDDFSGAKDEDDDDLFGD